MTLDDVKRVLAEYDRDHPPSENALDKWRREQAEQEQRFAHERAQSRNLTDAEMARWQEHFAGLVAAERDYMMLLLPELVAQMREEISTEIQTAYKTAFGLLRDDLDALRRELRKLSGGPSGEVVELPNPIGRLN